MSEKHINYYARTFDDFNSELVKFSKTYYPEIAETFNDASIGKWLIDLYSAVGDDLSYHIDRVYQNTNINSTTSMSALMNMARQNGVKVPGPKAAMCEIEVKCRIPVKMVNNNGQPNWDYAPIVKKDSRISNGEYEFELVEDANFAEQFNSNGYSNRKFVPLVGNNGGVVAYEVSKSVMAVNAVSHIYKQVLTSSDIKPFMEIVLPSEDVCSVDSVIFKESSYYNGTPRTEDFFRADELFRNPNESVYTRRYFEVDALIDQYIFTDDISADGDIYEDYSEDGTPICRIYQGSWKGLRQKFITEYTDKGYLKLIFGPGSNYESLEEAHTPGEAQMTKIVNNSMLGELPKEGWTMFIRYVTSNGEIANIAPGALNTFTYLNTEMPSTATNENDRSIVLSSITGENITTAYGGKDMPGVEELKNLIKYNVGAQKRCVTIGDYKAAIEQMPARYGCPFRTAVKEENNKVVLSFLNINKDGELSSKLPSLLVSNIENFLGMYKSLGDYVAMKSGHIFNLYINLDLYIDKNYEPTSVVSSVIETIKEYFSIKNHEMGDDIFLGNLEKEITSTDGVLSIIDFSVYNVYGGKYSIDIAPLPRATVKTGTCDTMLELGDVNLGADVKMFKIDREAIENILYNNTDSMFEIKYPKTDIAVHFKTK